MPKIKPKRTGRAAKAPRRKAALDPRPAVHQCILNAGATEPFSSSAPLSSINADPVAVQACVNGVFVIEIIVTKSDSENSIVTKVQNALG
jgi:hypothetical protein